MTVLSKKRKLMNSVFILHPWGFVVFLLLGTGLFVFAAAKIQIPVYTTVETEAVREGRAVRVDLGQKEFEAGTPVFLYRSRDDHLEKVTEYKVDKGVLWIEDGESLPLSGKVSIDIQTGGISLLRHILTEGGNR